MDNEALPTVNGTLTAGNGPLPSGNGNPLLDKEARKAGGIIRFPGNAFRLSHASPVYDRGHEVHGHRDPHPCMRPGAFMVRALRHRNYRLFFSADLTVSPEA